MDSKAKAIAVGVTALIVGAAAVGTYFYTKKGATQEEQTTPLENDFVKIEREEEKKEEEAAVEIAYAPNWAGFTDPDFASNHYITKTEAKNRNSLVSDVNYLIALGLVKGGETFNGKVTIDWMQTSKAADFVDDGDNSKCLFIDYKGKTIQSLTINGTQVTQDTPNLWRNHRIYVPNQH